MPNACPNLKLDPQDLPKAVLLPGDPSRAEAIASRLVGAKRIAANREYHSYRGEYEGIPVGVVSAGVGSAGAAVAYEEVIRAGGELLIRVGTAGSLREHVRPGDLVVVSSSVRADGTTRQLVPIEIPAVADPDVTAALWTECRRGKGRTHLGLCVTLDAFYPGVLDLGLQTYARAGAVCVEMECSALFVIGLLRGVRTGAIVAIDSVSGSIEAGEYDPHSDIVRQAVDREIGVALNAVRRLHEEAQCT
jgi:uridine phosphorylase